MNGAFFFIRKYGKLATKKVFLDGISVHSVENFCFSSIEGSNITIKNSIFSNCSNYGVKIIHPKMFNFENNYIIGVERNLSKINDYENMNNYNFSTTRLYLELIHIYSGNNISNVIISGIDGSGIFSPGIKCNGNPLNDFKEIIIGSSIIGLLVNEVTYPCIKITGRIHVIY